MTVDGTSHQLPRPFLVLATQNPIEFEGTYPLPEAQIDRFLIRTSLGYPSAADDAEIIQRRLSRRTDEVSLTQRVSPETLVAMQASLEDVVVSEAVVDYCVALVHATRSSPRVHAGASPRGVEALVKLSRSLAVLDGRSYVTPDDVKQAAVPALAHRIVLLPELWVRGIEADSVVLDCLESVPTPSTLPAGPDADQ